MLLAVAVCGALAAVIAGQVVAKPSALTVAAASDLRPAFEELGAVFEKSTGRQVVFVFGSSGMLARQIEAGAPYDVFASADPAYIDALLAKGRLVPATRRIFALGQIVLALRPNSGLHTETMADVLQPSVRTISIANPDHAPYGAAARHALQAAGVWENAQQRIIYADNAAVAVRFLETGNADAGIVPLSLAKAAGLDYKPVDPALYDRLQQTIVAVPNGRQAEAAQEFITFLEGPQSSQILDNYAYMLPGAQ